MLKALAPEFISEALVLAYMSATIIAVTARPGAGVTITRSVIAAAGSDQRLVASEFLHCRDQNEARLSAN